MVTPRTRKPGCGKASENMTDKTIDLDQRRGMAAQKATGLRRILAEVEANAPAAIIVATDRSASGELA